MENDQIAEDERLIKQYREDTDKKRAQIEELKTTWVPELPALYTQHSPPPPHLERTVIYKFWW